MKDQSAINADELQYIQNYNASFSEYRDLIDNVLNIPSAIRSFIWEIIATKGRVLFANWQLNFFMGLMGWYYIISFCPVDGGIPELIYELVVIVDDLWLVIIVFVGLFAHMRLDRGYFRMF